MENWKELLASFGLWSLVEDISDDGDGKGDNLQLTKDGELFASEIEKELSKAREEGRREYARELLDDYYQPDSDSIEVDVSEIQRDLSKLEDNK